MIRDALMWREAKGDEHVDGDATLPRTLRFVHAAIETILDRSDRGAERGATRARVVSGEDRSADRSSDVALDRTAYV